MNKQELIEKINRDFRDWYIMGYEYAKKRVMEVIDELEDS